MKRSLVIAILIASTTARGDVWKRAIDPEPVSDVYDALMQKGDDAATAANSQSIGVTSIVRQIDVAIEAYGAAAKAKPTAAEPHYRIGAVLNSFYFDDCRKQSIRQGTAPLTCRLTVQFAERAKQTLQAWDAFEALAPLDPRINEIVFERAILRTKLLGLTKITQPESLLNKVIKDYQTLLDRQDGFGVGNIDGLIGNLAETHMMLGDVERAIELYKDAIRSGGGASTAYGLAVALDRDNRRALALSVIRSLGPEAFVDFRRAFDRGDIFFVPSGEEAYYFALAFEAFGEIDEAIVHWRDFIRRGAHPQYQPSAKDHLDKLTLRNNLRWESPARDLGREPLIPNPKRKRL